MSGDADTGIDHLARQVRYPPSTVYKWISGRNTPGCLPDVTDPIAPDNWEGARDSLREQMSYDFDFNEGEGDQEHLRRALDELAAAVPGQPFATCTPTPGESGPATAWWIEPVS